MKTGENTKVTCPNKACGKVFVKALSTTNLQKNSKASYSACPHCLTEIAISEYESENPPKENYSDVEFFDEKPAQNKEQVITCSHHFGYLGEREQKEQISEECLLCPEVIKCMYKK
jgi:hypothetical protein